MRIEKENKWNNEANMVSTENSPRILERFKTISIMPTRKVVNCTYHDQEKSSSELISKCRHANKFLLVNYKANDYLSNCAISMLAHHLY